MQFSISILPTVIGLFSYLLLVLRHDPYLVSMDIAVQAVMLSSELLPELQVEEALNLV